MASVVELTYYPVKGCAGTSVGEAPLTPAGLAHDRTFMAVSEEGVGRTQRRDPRLALVRPVVGGGGERIALHAPGVETLELRVDTAGARWKVDLFGTAHQGIDQGTGAKAGPEPLRTLAGYRRATGGGVACGTEYAVLRTGRLSVGDTVNVTSWGGSRRRGTDYLVPMSSVQ